MTSTTEPLSIDDDPTMPRHRGLLVIFEGLDFSGKTTQSRTLTERLVALGYNATRISFPDYETPTGRLLREYLRGNHNLDARAVHLLFSANRWEKIDEIEALIRAGTTVVCDRYSYSGIAYTVAKGVPFEWAQHADEDLLVPDIQFYLDISPEEASERLPENRAAFGQDDRHERADFLELVREAYLGILVNEEEWTIITATEPREEIAERVLRVVQQKFDEMKVH